MRFDRVTPLLTVFRILPAFLVGIDIVIGKGTEEERPGLFDFRLPRGFGGGQLIRVALLERVDPVEEKLSGIRRHIPGSHETDVGRAAETHFSTLAVSVPDEDPALRSVLGDQQRQATAVAMFPNPAFGFDTSSTQFVDRPRHGLLLRLLTHPATPFATPFESRISAIRSELQRPYHPPLTPKKR
nr:hypothetical protein [Hankyongella ginsenosidimutans]